MTPELQSQVVLLANTHANIFLIFLMRAQIYPNSDS